VHLIALAELAAEHVDGDGHCLRVQIGIFSSSSSLLL